MERFLIINPFGIGDVLFTTPVIRALKDKYPESFIGYWCNGRVKDLLKADPEINRIFALSRGDIKRGYKGLKRFSVLLNLIKEIKRERFDISLDFSLDSRYGLWSKLAGIKRRIGFDYRSRGRFLTDRLVLKGYSEKHVVDYYADLLKLIGLEPRGKALNLIVSRENALKARSRLTASGIEPQSLTVGIAMGGGESWGRDAACKQWPVKSFTQLANRLINELGAHVVLLGSASEKVLAGNITNEVKSKNVINFTGKINIEELSGIINELNILVCNDGGPLHMAVALGIKTVSIFGPVNDKVYGPYPPSGKHIVIKKDLECRPCYEDFRFSGCGNNKQCLENISVNEVFENVKSLL